MRIKITCCLVLIAVSYTYGFAQQNVLRQRAFGTSGTLDFRDIKVTYDGGAIFGGSSNANKGIDKTENNRDASGNTTDYWVVKVDSLGNKQWDKTLGGSNDESLSCILSTSDHGYLVGGASYSGKSGDKTDVNRGTQFYTTSDFWLVKLDSAGNIVWDKTYGGDEFDYLSSIESAGDGGYVLAGYSGSSTSGEKSEKNRGWNNDYWIVKIDASGNKQWDKTIGGPNDDYVRRIRRAKDSGYVIIGSSDSPSGAEKTEDNRSSDYDCWIVKIDNAGNKLWDKTIGGTGGDNGESIIPTSDGGYMAACMSASSISFDKTENSKGRFDYWIVKINGEGKKEWDKTIGGNGSDELTDMQQTRDSGFIVGGYSESGISGDKTEASRGSFDYWIVKLNKSGQFSWDKTIGGSKSDQSYALCEYKPDFYLIGGESYSNVSGDRNKIRKGFIDYWIIRFEYKDLLQKTIAAITSKASNPTVIPESTLKVYPVPASDVLHVQAFGKALYTLFSADGKPVLTKKLNGNGEIKVSHLPAGIYYLTNTSTGERRRIIIIR